MGRWTERIPRFILEQEIDEEDLRHKKRIDVKKERQRFASRSNHISSELRWLKIEITDRKAKFEKSSIQSKMPASVYLRVFTY